MAKEIISFGGRMNVDLGIIGGTGVYSSDIFHTGQEDY